MIHEEIKSSWLTDTYKLLNWCSKLFINVKDTKESKKNLTSSRHQSKLERNGRNERISVWFWNHNLSQEIMQNQTVIQVEGNHRHFEISDITG